METEIDTIEQLSREIENIQVFNSTKSNSTEDIKEKDINDLISLTEELIRQKENEVFTLRKMLLPAAHSFKESVVVTLIDRTVTKAKRDLSNLEKLKSKLQTLLC